MKLEPRKLDHTNKNGYRYIMWHVVIESLNRAHKLDGPASLTYDPNGRLVEQSFYIYNPIIDKVISYDEETYWNHPDVLRNKLNKILADT